MPHSISSIEQINLGYNQQEDRLLLKVGMVDKSEIALWITRRICKDLWHLLQNSHGQVVGHTKQPSINQQAVVALDQTATNYQAQLPAPKLAVLANQKEQAISAFSHEIAQQKSLEVMDFSTEYLSDRQALSELPVLVVQCSIVASESHSASLAFQAHQGESIKMGLTLELVVALTNMMQLATREAGWDLLMVQNNTALHLTAAEQVLH